MATGSKPAAKSNEAPAAPPTNPAPPAPAQRKFNFAIEDNIPIPLRRNAGGGESAYPFDFINVNQSFFVPPTDKMKEPWKTLTSLASKMGRELHPKQFTTARTKDANGNEGVRVWRTEDRVGDLPEKRKINRKSKADKDAEKERLEQEAKDGDTSQRQHPAPDFEDANTPPPPPPPPVDQSAVS